MSMMIKAFVVSWLIVEWSEALPGGAPSMSCSSMAPHHFAFQAQPLEESPFFVRQSKVIYNPGNDSITVALTSSKGRHFRGFLVKALNPISNRPIGRFRREKAVNRRDSCHAATHTDAEDKNFVSLHWTSEDVDEDNNFVVFEATFVESFRKFYVGVGSVFRGKPARQEIKSLQKRNRGKTVEHQEDSIQQDLSLIETAEKMSTKTKRRGSVQTN